MKHEGLFRTCMALRGSGRLCTNAVAVCPNDGRGHPQHLLAECAGGRRVLHTARRLRCDLSQDTADTCTHDCYEFCRSTSPGGSSTVSCHGLCTLRSSQKLGSLFHPPYDRKVLGVEVVFGEPMQEMAPSPIASWRHKRRRCQQAPPDPPPYLFVRFHIQSVTQPISSNEPLRKWSSTPAQNKQGSQKRFRMCISGTIGPFFIKFGNTASLPWAHTHSERHAIHG